MKDGNGGFFVGRRRLGGIEDMIAAAGTEPDGASRRQ